MRFLRAVGIAIIVMFLGFLLLSFLIYWPYPSRDTAAAWERNFQEGIVSGYSDFRGHWLDHDIAAYIFSYRCPDTTTGEQLFSELAAKNPEFTVHAHTSHELALRQPVTYSTPDGYNEWRFLLHPKTHRMSVLFANLDSEQAAHPRLVANLRKYHEHD